LGLPAISSILALPQWVWRRAPTGLPFGFPLCLGFHIPELLAFINSIFHPVAVVVAEEQRVWLRGNAHDDSPLCLAELLDANSSSGNVDVGLCVMSVTGVAKTPRGVGSLSYVVNPEACSSRLRPDLARILLRDATTVIVVFSSLDARLVRSF
jgi:hypothetical protein